MMALESVSAPLDWFPLWLSLRVAGIATPPGVWKYSTVVKPEQPALLHASTFQRYGLPALRLAVYEVLPVLVSTTSALVDISLTPTP